MVPFILEPLLLRGNDENIVVITFQDKVFHNMCVVNFPLLYVVITLQDKVFHNLTCVYFLKHHVVITLQNKVFHNNNGGHYYE